MENQLIIENTILINAAPAAVWDALTNPEQTKKYMFGCEPITDWQVGSPLLWKGSFDGTELVAVKGTILKIEPGYFLTYTTIDPNSAIEDIPENYLTVTYAVSAEGKQTRLAVTQGNYATVADGEKRYQDTLSEGGWNAVLEQIKQILEVNRVI
ncbi:SRPBCC domain-containing protein [Spirosoma sp. SC4-14]|uniref:SRPBCC domain-containing protein n=1 Tax=Spirosoma sp. SC4-14 TaxID=3128900 RepID=UPI0030D47999